MQCWEYTVADFTKLGKSVPELDKLGAEGWEAVGLISTWGAGWRFVHPVVLLKRPHPESAQEGTRARGVQGKSPGPFATGR
jgi:hypothetical protein